MIIHSENTKFDLELSLPLSKSETNRALMIAYYGGFAYDDVKISDSDDSLLLKLLLKQIYDNELNKQLELNCNNAGTVFRFLMTALSMKEGDWILNGSERMKKRPIKPLVDALLSLGASIEYMENDFFPPIRIKGKNIDGGRVEVSANESSQFVSSLLLASPLWKNGLVLTLKDEITSLPYIDLTINMMRQAGADVCRNDRTIVVKPSAYKNEIKKIEADWSAAAFWYEILSFSKESAILFNGLNYNSLQADSVAKTAFSELGVKSFESNDAVIIKNDDFITDNFHFDFTHCPDLFPSVIASCAGLSVNSVFSGLKNLSHKESDRKQAMINELSKINIDFEFVSDDVIKMSCPEQLPYFTENNPVVFNNYNDHRIAMALAPLSMKIGCIYMDNTDVVSKSYPGFWEMFKFLGLKRQRCERL